MSIEDNFHESFLLICTMIAPSKSKNLSDKLRSIAINMLGCSLTIFRFNVV